MQKKRISVIGAGVGGLATAARLAHRGHDVTVFEKQPYLGGRNAAEQVGSCQFDGGPTLLLMLDPWRKLWADLGEDFDAQIEPVRLDPSYRVFFADGVSFEGTPDVYKMTENIRALAGDRAAAKYPAFLAELKDLYDESIPHFVRKNYRSLGDFASLPQLQRVVQHHMLGNLWNRVAGRFENPKLRMLFSFQTMYLGLSPFDAPWVYATLAYMEYGEGVFYPKRGLSGLSQSIADLATARGAKMLLDTPVRSIEGSTVVLCDGRRVEADAVIANADMPYAARELDQKPIPRKLRYSCSAHLIYIDYEGELSGLEHHNVFFGADFKGNLDAIFHDLKPPEDPAFYACLSCLSDPALAPEGHQNLFLLIPVPNLDRPLSPTELEKIEGRVFERLSESCQFDPSKIRAIKRRGPQEWQNELNLDRGAAFGISHDLFQSAFMRPQNKSKTNSSLFYVGASTVPGNGLPMVLISAELVEQRLIAEGVIAG